MKPLMEWLKNKLTEPRTYFFLLAVSLFIPFIINFLYLLGLECEHPFITMWRAEDVLAFYGSFLSFLGTVVLGAVAVFQTDRANEQSDTANNISTEALNQAKQSNLIAKEALEQTQKANDLAAEMQKLERAKYVSLVSLTNLTTSKHSVDHFYKPNSSEVEVLDMVSQDYFSSSSNYHVDITFTNESDFPILHISAHAGDRNDNKNLNYDIKSNEKSIYVPPHGKICIRFLIPTRAFEHYSTKGIAMQFSFTNVYDFSSSSTLIIENLSINGTNTNYTYQLAKLTNFHTQSHTEDDVDIDNV